MKIIVAIAMVVLVVFATFATAISAGTNNQPSRVRAVFEADIIRSIHGTDPLTKGKGYVRADGSIKVEIEGALPDTEYIIILIYGRRVPAPRAWGPYSVTTDSSGNFVVTGTLSDGDYGTPRFAIRRQGVAQFITGIQLPSPTDRTVFETDIIRSIDATDLLTKGEGYVRADGSVKVEIEGALPNTEYMVAVRYGPYEVALGDWIFVTTDSSGNFVVTGTLADDQYRMPRFTIRRQGVAQFITGVLLPDSRSQ